jgi:hydroxyacylglutathione hydrolase
MHKPHYNVILISILQTHGLAMVEITPIPAFSDNYIWAIHNTQYAVIVDPGDATPVKAWLDDEQQQLAGILITHHHHDHIGGVAALCQQHSVPVYGPVNIDVVTQIVADRDQITLKPLGLTFTVLSTPGHTLNHLCYFNDQWLFCGDTLFVGGCGRLFEGTPTQMLNSFERLRQLPGKLQVFCAHEYTLDNLRFAQEIDPDNAQLTQFYQAMQARRQQQQPTVPSTLQQEWAINPYFTCLDAQHRQQFNLPAAACKNALDAFTLIRHNKDQWCQ